MRGAMIIGLCVAALAGVAGIAAAKDPEPTKAPTKVSSHDSITEGIDCGNCHTPAGWKMSGGKAGEGFDHSRTGFPLTGRHEPAACNQCHSGERRVTRECVGCHESPHQKRLSGRCDSCHSSTRWNDLEAFEIHRRTRFPLTGMHALAPCTGCHLRNGEREWTTVQSDCFSCHSADYLDPSVHPNHRASPGVYIRDCSQCHTARAWSPAFIDPTAIASSAISAVSTRPGRMAVPVDHDRLFPVSRGPHRGAACNSCHTSVRTPRLVQCSGCHAHNPVKLLQQHGRRVSNSGVACLGCHPGGTAR
ncbi:MAG: hypothetical protein WBM46_12285 [Polyangiales bacterium]